MQARQDRFSILILSNCVVIGRPGCKRATFRRIIRMASADDQATVYCNCIERGNNHASVFASEHHPANKFETIGATTPFHRLPPLTTPTCSGRVPTSYPFGTVAPTMEPLQFVNVTRCEVDRSKNTYALGVSQEDRRRIRIQVQRDFRRKEKQRLSNNATSPQSTGSPFGPWSAKDICEVTEELSSGASPLPQIPSAINTPDLWLDSFAQSMTEECYPRDNGSMHVLANNVAYSYQMKCDTPMRAIREALSFLHVGSTLEHESILHEGMKRYVCAINLLREDATQKRPSMTVSGLTMVGMGILLCQVL